MRSAIWPWVLAGVLSAASLFATDPPKSKPGFDPHGDPLPPRAIARLGTVRFSGPLQTGPDAKSLLTIRGNRIAVVDSETGAATRYLPGPDPLQLEVHSFLLAEDTRRVVYCGVNQIQVWDVDRGQCLHSMPLDQEDGPDEVRPIAILDHHLILEIGIWHHVIACCDLSSGKMAWTSKSVRGGGGNDGLKRIVGPDTAGTGLFVLQKANEKIKLQLLALENGQQVRELPIDSPIIINSAELAPDGKEIAAFDTKGHVHRIDVATGRSVKSWNAKLRKNDFGGGAEDYVSPVCFSADGTKIAATDMSAIRIFETATGKEISHTSSMSYLGWNVRPVFTKDGSTVWYTSASSSSWQGIEAATGKPKKLPTLEGHKDAIQCAALSPDGSQLVTIDAEAGRVWDTATGLSPKKIYDSRTSFFGVTQLSEVAYSADGAMIAGLSQSGQAIRWEVANTKKPKSSKNLGRSFYWGAIGFSPNTDVVAMSAGQVGFQPFGRQEEKATVGLFDVKTGKELRRFPAITGWRSGLSFSPDGRHLLVMGNGSNGSAAAVHSAETGKCVHSLGNDLSTAKFAPFGGNIAFIADNQLIIRELCTAQTRVRISLPQEHSIDILAISPEGRWVAAACTDGSPRKIFLWDLRNGTAMEPLVGHDQAITNLLFGPDGRLVSIASDLTALVWDVRDAKARDVPKPVATDELVKLWETLTSDAARCHVSIDRLVEGGPATIAFLRERVRPATPIETQAISRWLDMIDSAKYQDRHRATVALESLDIQAEPYLRQWIANSANSPEARARAERLLARLSGTVSDPEKLRELRCIEVLTRIGTADAKEVLKHWSGGDANARLTRAAGHAVSELNARTPPSPTPTQEPTKNGA